MDPIRERPLADLAASTDSLTRLEFEHARLVAASRSSNADDEHDPEGSTIAFERQQVTALLAQTRRTCEDLERALTQLAQGSYGRCERCGDPIGTERLQARPNARSCIACAT